MLRVMPRFLVHAALAAWCATTMAADAPPAAIDGNRLKLSLTRALRKVELSATPLPALRRQFAHKRCTLDLPSPCTTAMTPAQIYQCRRDSVFVMSALYHCGKCTNAHTSVAAAFCIASNGVMATNYHVMDHTNGQFMAAVSFDGVAYPVREILAADKDADVAIVRVQADNLVPIPLGTSARAGDPVYVISHPSSHFFLYTSGMVSGYYIPCAHTSSRGARMAITADFAQGSSGGPVLDTYGNIAGMVSSTQTVATEDEKDHERTQMVLKNCVPVHSIRALITQP